MNQGTFTKTKCGVNCLSCKYRGKECAGCNIIKGKPFWVQFINATICPIYECCEQSYHLAHCGECHEFPCDLFKKMAFADPNIPKDEAQKDLDKRIKILLERSRKEKKKLICAGNVNRDGVFLPAGNATRELDRFFVHPLASH